jgi:tungstate transport system substrate-binding protein
MIHRLRVRLTVRSWLPVLSLCCCVAPAVAAERDDAAKLLLATTSSVHDSGLLDALLPVFRERTGITVQVVAVGSGAALRMGADGNADVLVTHDEAGERALLASGAAASRTPFMENHFVIAGPPEDPAAVATAEDPTEAYRRIAAAKAPYVSRGDDSGTHRRERELLAKAGLDPAKPWQRFTSTGSGMGLTLQVAGEKRAYVLSDLGTFLAYRERTRLLRLTKDAPLLRNEYAVLRIDPERFAGRVRGEVALRFEAFLVEPDTQRRIGEFGRERFGEPLFRPLHPIGSGGTETESGP